MPTLEIEGRDIEVDDSFLSMTPDEQNRAVEEIAGQLGISAGASRQTPSAARAVDKSGYGGKDVNGAAGSGFLGALDALSFGFADEIGAGINSTIDSGLEYATGRKGKSYDEWLAKNRGLQQNAQDQHGGAYLTGQIAGGVGTGAGMVRGGASLGANAIREGGSLLRGAVGSAADGAIIGAISGAGGGEDMQSRAKGGVGGLVLGGSLGLGAPYLTAGVAAAAKPFIAPIASRLKPEAYARDALATSMRRSGRTVDEIGRELDAARLDGQDMYTVADALGNEGARRLSTVARSPSDAREMAVRALEDRQIGQGERLSSFLADGFDAPDTAAQRIARLTAERRTAADANYGTARADAGAVDVSGAIRAADEVVSPGVSGLADPGTSIADDTLEGAVRRVRSLFTDGRSMKSDFNQVLRAKHDIADRISVAQRNGQGNKVRVLSQINRELDAALERSSAGYRQANDTFRQQSRVIDAVDAGGAAASGRTRAADNIEAFRRMTPEQQAAFRAGYADPLIQRVGSSAVSPSTNKARPLMTGKSGQEFPEFAAPGRDEQLRNRIGREQRMFETYNAARGGSRTADNLADQAETATFDPGIVFNVIAGKPAAAASAAVVPALRSAQGLPPPVIRRMAETLLETNPQAARRLLGEAMQTRAGNDNVRALGNAILVAMSANASGPGR